MKYKYNDIEYDIQIIRKNNKNTYLRFKDNKIVITTNYFVSNKEILKLIENNTNFINKAINNSKREDDINFKLFGIKYNIIYIDKIKEVKIDNNNIYTKDDKMLDKYLSKVIYNKYLERLYYWHNIFEEKLPYCNLVIRKMKTRWGVCNIKNKKVTLNLELSRYDIKYLDYVIIHELSHFIYQNHSKDFWNLVRKYCNDYKKLKYDMKSFYV